jgi:hypothetical protein
LKIHNKNNLFTQELYMSNLYQEKKLKDKIKRKKKVLGKIFIHFYIIIAPHDFLLQLLQLTVSSPESVVIYCIDHTASIVTLDLYLRAPGGKKTARGELGGHDGISSLQWTPPYCTSHSSLLGDCSSVRVPTKSTHEAFCYNISLLETDMALRVCG